MLRKNWSPMVNDNNPIGITRRFLQSWVMVSEHGPGNPFEMLTTLTKSQQVNMKAATLIGIVMNPISGFEILRDELVEKAKIDLMRRVFVHIERGAEGGEYSLVCVCEGIKNKRVEVSPGRFEEMPAILPVPSYKGGEWGVNPASMKKEGE